MPGLSSSGSCKAPRQLPSLLVPSAALLRSVRAAELVGESRLSIRWQINLPGQHQPASGRVDGAQPLRVRLESRRRVKRACERARRVSCALMFSKRVGNPASHSDSQSARRCLLGSAFGSNNPGIRGHLVGLAFSSKSRGLSGRRVARIKAGVFP